MARRLATRLTEMGVVPAEKSGDALQMAITAAHRIDYLLSWNYAHFGKSDRSRATDGRLSETELTSPFAGFAGIDAKDKPGPDNQEAKTMIGNRIVESIILSG